MFHFRPSNNSFHYDYFYPQYARDVYIYISFASGWTPIIYTEHTTIFTKEKYGANCITEYENLIIPTFDIIFLSVLNYPFNLHRNKKYPDLITAMFILSFDFENRNIYQDELIGHDINSKCCLIEDKVKQLDYENDSILQKLYQYALKQSRHKSILRYGE